MFSGVSELIKRYRKKTLRDGGSLFQFDEATEYLHTVLEFRTSLHNNCNHRGIERFWTIVTDMETDICTMAETLYICTCTYMCSLCIHTMYMHLCLCVSLCIYYVMYVHLIFHVVPMYVRMWLFIPAIRILTKSLTSTVQN